MADRLPKLDVTRGDIADAFGVTTRTVDNWVLTGKLKAYRIGRVVRFNRDEVMAALVTSSGAA